LCSVQNDCDDQILKSAGEDFAGVASRPFNDLMLSSDPADAIDQMIIARNPECDDCGEVEQSCRCQQYVYDGMRGRFDPGFDANFVCVRRWYLETRQ
jgi:hypothetical protein